MNTKMRIAFSAGTALECYAAGVQTTPSEGA
jgi:hypothetical protein